MLKKADPDEGPLFFFVDRFLDTAGVRLRLDNRCKIHLSLSLKPSPSPCGNC